MERTRVTILNYKLLPNDWQGEGRKIMLIFFPDIQFEATIASINIIEDSSTSWELVCYNLFPVHFWRRVNLLRLPAIDKAGKEPKQIVYACKKAIRQALVQPLFPS